MSGPPMNLHFHLFVALLAGWVNRHQQVVIEYLQAENRVLREQLGSKRVRWTDAQRRIWPKRPKLSAAAF